MTQKLTYVAMALICLGCSKRAEDESVKSAAAPATPAQESERGADELATPGATPAPITATPEAPAAEPAEDRELGSAVKKSEKSKKDGLEEQKGQSFTSVAQAEAALNEESTRLTKLLGGAKAQPLSTGDKRCDQACLAFASLKRAADAICRLAGDGDSRCGRAKRIVDDNEAKVKACACEE